MKRSETIEIIEKLRRAYPRFIQTTEIDPDIGEVLKKTTDVWHEFLGPLPSEACRFAVMRLISESKYAPSISEVMERVSEIHDVGGGDANDAWNALARAAERASVLTREQFEALPSEARAFCGSLSGLRDLGMVDVEVFNTVTRGQFMKAYDGLRRRRETLEIMPPEVVALVRSVVKPMPVLTAAERFPGGHAAKAQLQETGVVSQGRTPTSFSGPALEERGGNHAPLTDDEWNARRNELLESLERSLTVLSGVHA